MSITIPNQNRGSRRTNTLETAVAMLHQKAMKEEEDEEGGGENTKVLLGGRRKKPTVSATTAIDYIHGSALKGNR
jgi:hypothetical protein